MTSAFKDKVTVLAIDDSAEALGMINMTLAEAGMVALIALNGQQALQVLEQVTPDIILMDAVMPVMDGFECAQVVRKKLPLVPIIFMTGLSDVGDIVKAFDAGGNDYIVKPIREQELLVRIRQHCNSSRMLMEAQKVLDAMRQHVFCISRQGSILWATPEAQLLLNQYLKQTNNPAAEPLTPIEPLLSSWLSSGQIGHDLALPIVAENFMLTVEYYKQAEENQFLLKIRSPNVGIDPAVLEQALMVTNREAEVLLWVAHGKTNREIAEILSMSPRTVNKHLEQMYPKIGAENRTSAAAIAIQTILGGKIGRPLS